MTQLAKTLTKNALIAQIAEDLHFTRKQVGAVLESVVQIAYSEARNGFTFPGLGKLFIVNRKARVGRNPATGQTLEIPAKQVLKFRVAKAAKDAVLGAEEDDSDDESMPYLDADDPIFRETWILFPGPVIIKPLPPEPTSPTPRKPPRKP